jgi:hypothetical protein
MGIYLFSLWLTVATLAAAPAQQFTISTVAGRYIPLGLVTPARRGPAIIPFIPLRMVRKNGHEESVSCVALYQRLERISSLFTFDG